MVAEVVVNATKKLNWLSTNALEAISPAVEALPGVADSFLELLVTARSNEFSLGVSSDPVGAVRVIWRADNLNTLLSEVLGVVLDVSADRVLVLVVYVGFALDEPFLLLVVLEFKLIKRLEVR